MTVWTSLNMVLCVQSFCKPLSDKKLLFLFFCSSIKGFLNLEAGRTRVITLTHSILKMLVRVNLLVDLLVRMTTREIRRHPRRIHHQLKLLPWGLGQIQWCESPRMKDVQAEKMIFVVTRLLLESHMLGHLIINTVIMLTMIVRQEKLAWNDRLCILTTKQEL
jgi:hypothetical protein